MKYGANPEMIRAGFICTCLLLACVLMIWLAIS